MSAAEDPSADPATEPSDVAQDPTPSSAEAEPETFDPRDVGAGDEGFPEPADTATAEGTLAAAVANLDLSSEEAVAEAVELAQRYEAERDEYLDNARRLKADYENYKRRVETQRADQRAQAALELVRELLPVLDAFDAAVIHGNEEVVPLQAQLVQTLEKQGLEVVGETGVDFDPNIHEAVMHEDGDGEAVVAEVMRTGYLWNGRVARAAMVKVRG